LLSLGKSRLLGQATCRKEEFFLVFVRGWISLLLVLLALFSA